MKLVTNPCPDEILLPRDELRKSKGKLHAADKNELTTETNEAYATRENIINAKCMTS